MNEGCLKPIDIVLPEGSIAQPPLPGRGLRRQCRDLAVGHRRALRRARRAGRRPGHDEQLHLRQRQVPILRDDLRRLGRRRRTSTAPSAVHTHMTNSRLTDPEVLEWRYPGAAGQPPHRPRLGRRGPPQGRRRHGPPVRFLEPMTAALLSNHRKVPPFGLAGGRPGACGRPVGRARGRRVDRLEGGARQDGGGDGRYLRHPDAERGWVRGEVTRCRRILERSDLDVASACAEVAEAGGRIVITRDG